jgi:hypothetical protein
MEVILCLSACSRVPAHKRKAHIFVAKAFCDEIDVDIVRTVCILSANTRVWVAIEPT